MFMNITTKHFELGGIPVKKLLTSVSFIVLSSATVLAADLPMKAAPMMAPAPVFSWTGCYIGGHVGAGTMRDSNTTDGSVVSGLELSLLGGGNNGTGTGAIAGGQVGCNYQDGNFVFGLEGEGYWSGIKTTTGFSLPNEVTVTETAKNKNDFSIAARAGIAFDRTFVYGKAGWVWGAFDFGFNEAVNGDGITVLSVAQSGNLNGLLLGVGVEHALTRNWTVKLEYNFLNYGSKFLNSTVCEGAVCEPFGSSSQHASKQIFKVGANYLFNWGAAPLAARY